MDDNELIEIIEYAKARADKAAASFEKAKVEYAELEKTVIDARTLVGHLAIEAEVQKRAYQLLKGDLNGEDVDEVVGGERGTDTEPQEHHGQ